MAEGRFAGQVVMITGAAGGFGAAAAHRFAGEGARLALSDNDKSGLETTVNALSDVGAEVISDVIDITSEKQVIAHIEHVKSTFDSPSVAVNNAGIGQLLQRIDQTSVEDFDRIMAVNARGVFNCMKHQLPGMVAANGGVILNIASAAGLVGAGHFAAYAASKHAVVGLTRAAADEYAHKGIRINTLCPSFAPTALFNEMADQVGEAKGLDRQAAYDRITSRIPMRRVATIDEVVQAMLWACDPANSFMTGQAISIDGGLTAI